MFITQLTTLFSLQPFNRKENKSLLEMNKSLSGVREFMSESKTSNGACLQPSSPSSE